MHFLFISTYLRGSLNGNITAVYKRIEMFISAIKELGSLDMLFYVSSDIDTSESSVAEIKRFLSMYWNTEINIFLCPKFENKEKLSCWQSYGASAFSFFKQDRYISTSGSRQIQAFKDCLRRKPTAIMVHRLESMCPLLLSDRTQVPVYLDLDDIEHLSFIRNIGQPPRWRGKPLQYLQVPALWWGERRAIKLARRTFVCSEKDRNYLEKFWGLPGVRVVPNATTIPKPFYNTKPQILLFIGNYNYQPNVNAAEFLIKEIWPHVYQAVPEARLLIAGSSSEKISYFTINISGVKYTGFVDDLDTLYQQSRIICCPILSGGGTRYKIIEAAAYGKPVVSTSIGAEGLEMLDGQELFIRDDPISFAEACIKLLKDSNLCKQLGTAARETVIRQYNRDNIIRLIQQYITETN